MHCARAGAAATLLLSVLGAAALAAPPGPLPDWPCPGVTADQLHPDEVWPGGLPASLPAREAWLADAKARPLVEFIADPENSPAMGAARIADFSKANGKLAPDTAMLVLTGMLERINNIRGFLIEGIRANVIKSHILAEAVAANDASLARAAAQPASDAAGQPDAIRKARYLNLHALDDAGDGAAMLCHRYAYDERKARTLAAALREHME